MSKLPFNYDAWRMNNDDDNLGYDVYEVEGFFTDCDEIAESFEKAVDEYKSQLQREIFSTDDDTIRANIENLAEEYGLFWTEDELHTAVAERLWEEKLNYYYGG